jgi:glycine/D-amino acid oxidase-like deaminating enzyme
MAEKFSIKGTIAYDWSGQVLEPLDGLAFIGRNPGKEENIYIATGDSGNGITHGTVAGVIISDLILKGKNQWANVYDPSRKIRTKAKRASRVSNRKRSKRT